METKTVTLTEAELALVEANRKKEAAEAEAKAARKLVDDAKKIALEKSRAAELQLQHNNLDRAAEYFFNDLAGIAGILFYTHDVKVATQSVVAYNYLGNDQREILATFEVKYNEHTIYMTKNPSVKIIYRMEDGYYRAKIEGIGHSYPEKWYKTAKKVHEKIFNHFDEITQKNARKEKALSIQDQLVNLLTEQNPTATITKDVDVYHSQYGHNGRRLSRYQQGERHDIQVVRVKFANSLCITYTGEIDANQKLVAKVRSVNHNIDQAILIEVLKNVPAKVQA